MTLLNTSKIATPPDFEHNCQQYITSWNDIIKHTSMKRQCYAQMNFFAIIRHVIEKKFFKLTAECKNAYFSDIVQNNNNNGNKHRFPPF